MRTDIFYWLARNVQVTNDAAMRHDGSVLPPTLMVFRGDELVCSATMRPAYDGADGAAAVVEMGMLASAFEATDVVVFWEQSDLAVLCGGPRGNVGHAIHVYHARPDAHTLATFPFTIQIRQRSRDGIIDVEWGPARWDQVDGPLPTVVDRLLGLCWQSTPLPSANESDVAAHLESLGHRIQLCKQS